MRILIIEDDLALCETMRYNLEHNGYSVDICNDGESALDWINQPAYSLIILDRMLPGLSGIDILTKIRQNKIAVHVLMVTALGTVSDRVSGLDAGADDYLSKPFAMSELLARVRSFSRRLPEVSQYNNNIGITVGDITLDMQRNLLHGPKSSYELSGREAQLLEVFINNPRLILPREMLFSRVWGPYADVESGNLDSYIHYLRKRLSETGSQCKIKTSHGIGYKLEVRGDSLC